MGKKKDTLITGTKAIYTDMARDVDEEMEVEVMADVGEGMLVMEAMAAEDGVEGEDVIEVKRVPPLKTEIEDVDATAQMDAVEAVLTHETLTIQMKKSEHI